VTPDFPAALDAALGHEGARLVRRSIAAGPPTAFVGGWVRDALIGRASGDVDLVTSDPDALVAAMQAAGARKAVCLDPARGTWRVVLRGGLFVDLSGLKGGSLEEDLRARDLTINAIAWTPDGGLIDPLGGADDLRAGRLRLASPSSLRDDPLRALRVARFALRLDAQPDLELLEEMRAADVDRISAERIQVELAAILLEPAAGAGMTLLADCGLLRVLPPCTPARLDRALARRWDSPALARVRAQALHTPPGELALRLGWLLDPGAEVSDLVRRRWPRKVAERAAAIANQADRPPAQDDRARARELVGWSCGAVWPLLALGVDGGEEAVAPYLRLLDEGVGARNPKGLPVPPLPRPLVPSARIRQRLGAGPQVGEALDALLVEQLCGTIGDGDAARAWIARAYSSQ
jgi:tRNA nucleotidyltransferase/poly(A) polymerase